MQVSRYFFQSPYSSQVQLGRPDTTTSGEQQSRLADSGLKKAADQ